MPDFDDLLEELKQKRDELRVQMNLASREMRDEWEELEDKLEEFTDRARQVAEDADLKATGEGVGKALGQLGEELKRGYDRIWRALREE
mgnify:CR=1 FL=1